MTDSPHGYDAFGLIGTPFGELEWKAPIFFERAVPISPNAWQASHFRQIAAQTEGYSGRAGHGQSSHLDAAALRYKSL